MKLSLLAVSSLSMTSASLTDSLRRRLSFEKIAGYAPGTQVTDHCAIDLDQAAIETELAKQTDSSFATAGNIYNQGGSSKSYAQITLSTPLSSAIQNDAVIVGTNADGSSTVGKAYEDYPQGTTSLKVQYQTSDMQANHVTCMVGGLPTDLQTTVGCLAGSGSINIAGQDYDYTYDPTTDNNNGRTIAGFSTDAGQKMRLNCDGCPYDDHRFFYNYYGVDDYGHQWVTAALNGEKTTFDKGNADFSVYSLNGRTEAVKKGTVFLNIFQYVIREFEDALDDCERGCDLDACNDDAVHAWDEGVCFYTGSIEAQDGVTSDGKLLHQLADKRCADFKTCSKDGGELEGQAKLNHDLFKLYAKGKYELQTKNCGEARSTVNEITKLLYIPFIQGTLRYAYKMDKLGDDSEKSAAEAAVFAAAVLPRIAAADEAAADTIYENVKVGVSTTDFADVKEAFEFVYKDLGIKCSDIGGLWNSALGEYYEGAGPCKNGLMSEMTDDKLIVIIVGSTLGGLFFISVLFLCFSRARKSSGAGGKQPDLEATTDAEVS
ncbi:unnamed protein product [Cylindrotheca closterium]|uniref:Uncharacterized protein n=1 Tax=Cylindrotheca closterium TaxID=2856 RepID=A0AAD2JH37_9STRA|nr:unnamed protein product [Cylindrotheca closterium]